MKRVVLSGAFKRDLKKIARRQKDLSKLYTVVEKLAKGEALEHFLSRLMDVFLTENALAEKHNPTHLRVSGNRNGIAISNPTGFYFIKSLRMKSGWPEQAPMPIFFDKSRLSKS